MNKYLLRTLAPGLLIATGTFFSQANLRADDARKVTQAEAMKQAVAKPQPDYPAIAKQLKLEGRVEIEASISEDGSVEGVKILNGNAVLTNAAAAAMKRWKFQPFTDSGKPVRAVATLTFTFKL
jgi:periplasmic protein TonB